MSRPHQHSPAIAELIPTDRLTDEAIELWEAIENHDHETGKSIFANAKGPMVASVIAELLRGEETPVSDRIAEFISECYGL